jgi:hypothetical protein
MFRLLFVSNVEEAYYSEDISEKIDEVKKDAHNGKLCIKPLAAGEVEMRG